LLGEKVEAKGLRTKKLNDFKPRLALPADVYGLWIVFEDTWLNL
jgi:hypothetical protein